MTKPKAAQPLHAEPVPVEAPVEAVRLTQAQRMMLCGCSGLDIKTVRVIYNPSPDRGVRDASYTRACETAAALGLPLPPPRKGDGK